MFNIFYHYKNYFIQSFNGINTIFTSIKFTIIPKLFNVIKLTMKFEIIYNLITYRIIKSTLKFFFNFTFLYYKIKLKRSKILSIII